MKQDNLIPLIQCTMIHGLLINIERNMLLISSMETLKRHSRTKYIKCLNDSWNMWHDKYFDEHCSEMENSDKEFPYEHDKMSSIANQQYKRYDSAVNKAEKKLYTNVDNSFGNLIKEVRNKIKQFYDDEELLNRIEKELTEIKNFRNEFFHFRGTPLNKSMISATYHYLSKSPLADDLKKNRCPKEWNKYINCDDEFANIKSQLSELIPMMASIDCFLYNFLTGVEMHYSSKK